jgi:DNA polymerase-3 subunit epsilon
MAFEIEHERHPGARAAGERLDGGPADRPNRAVDSTESEYARRIVFDDLVGRRHLALAHAPVLGAFRADPGRLVSELLRADELFLRISVHQALNKSGLRLPECVWLDSSRVARRTWTQFAHRGYGLGNLCNHIGYEFEHHDALEDAKAAGQVMLAAMEATGLSVEDWLRRVGQPIDPETAKPITRDGNPEGSLFGEIMVFTGALLVPRREAADLAAGVGCEVGENVTKHTTMLVVGDQDVTKLAGHEKSSKHRKAESLITQGQGIRVLRESDFMELVALG